MTTPANPELPPTPAPPSPTPSGGTPTNDSANLANMVAPEYVYPNNESVPEYLRGKTASDAAKLLAGLVESYGRNATQPQAPAQPLAPQTDDEYVTAAHLRQAQQAALSQVNPWLQTVAEQQATFAYNAIKDKHPDIFRKYEPEVIQVLQSVPRQNWTLDVVQKAVTMVKGSHVEELVTDKVRQLEATMGSAMRSTGRAGPTSEFQTKDTIAERLGKAPPDWQTRAKAAGITDATVMEMCQANDMTPDQFFQWFGKDLITDAVAEVKVK